MTDFANSGLGSRFHITAYWIATALVVFELILGGIWDILRVPQVRSLVERLGYPQYFLVILGIWKLLGRCRISRSAISPTQRVGIRRCALRLDGRCCIAVGLRVD